jgi:hypothetical protein
MRLPVDLGNSMPDPLRDIRTVEVELEDELEWSYRVAREIIRLGHRRAKSRYNERVIEKRYKRGAHVLVLVHSHPNDVHLKLNSKFSGLCKVIEVLGPELTLQELDTQRIFTASYDAVLASTLHTLEPPIASAPIDSQQSEESGDHLDTQLEFPDD